MKVFRIGFAAFVLSLFLETGLQGQTAVGSWLQRATASGMTSRVVATGVWTGREFIVWGGEGPGVAYRTGGRYSPSSNQWSYIDPGAVLSARSKHTAVWTGSEMIVWGGYTGGNYFNDGARYSPATETWTGVAPNASLIGRHDHFAVWTGTEMIVWGGYNQSGYLADGGAYNPVTDQWRNLPASGAPSARATGMAVWTGTEMIVWGGGLSGTTTFTTGARFNPVENKWYPMSTNGAPEGRYWASAVWTGTEMMVWGGRNSSSASLATGGRYNPLTDTWQPVSSQNAPALRDRHVAVWTGSKMIVWGGYSTIGGPYQQSGGIYDPLTDSWTALATTGSPSAFICSTAVWTGRSMLVFGGYNGGYDRNVFSCVIDPLDDGIPASWRQQFFGAEFAHDPRVLATADPDGDGANNYQEYVGGTEPLDGASNPERPLEASTFAGSVAGNQDGYRTEATFFKPGPLKFDGAGRLWMTEIYLTGFQTTGVGGHRIRVMDTEGVFTTISGSDEPGLVEGPAALARYRGPNAIVFDSHGNLFVTDRLNHRIRKLDAEGMVSTFAGSTAGLQDGMGSSAQFHTPIGMVIDGEDNLYVADFDNYRIRKVTSAGEVSTYAGGVRGFRDGDRSVALFDSPGWLAYGPDGSLYVSDWAVGKVRKISPSGEVSTFASGLQYIDSVSVDAVSNVYASAGGSHKLTKFAPDGSAGWMLSWVEGFADGPVGVAKFSKAFGDLTFLPDGSFLVSDSGNDRIRRVRVGVPPLVTISPRESLFTNSVDISLSTTVASGVVRYTLDGGNPTPASPVYGGTFTLTAAAVVKAAVFVNDNPVSEVLTQAFSRVDPFDDGIPANWRQQYFGADFARDPRVLATADPDQDGANNYQEFLAGTNPLNANSVKQVPISVSTFAGSAAGGQDGFRTNATFLGPGTLTYDSAGRIWVCELTIEGYVTPVPGAHRIRIIDTAGNVTAYAGSTEFGAIDGPLASARFAGPSALSFDAAGNVFILERSNHRIRKIDVNGTVSTLAGSTVGFQDGTGIGAKFNMPMGMCIDRADNLFVADFENRRVRKVTPQGEVTTYAGGVQGYQDGDRSVARFHTPDDISIGPDGTLYVADWAIGCIRTINTNGIVGTFASGLTYVERVFVDAQTNVYASVGIDASYRKFKPDGSLEWKIQNPTGFQDGPISVARFGHFGETLVMPDGNLLISDGQNNRLRLITMGAPPLVNITPAESRFTNSINVSLSTTATNGVLRYTVDGADPTPSSQTYAGVFTLNAAATVKAGLFVNDIRVSDVLPQTFARVYALDDGIPASWRAQHFGTGYLTDPRVAWNADPDSDGANNLQEYVDGSDPLDAASHGRAPAGEWLQRATASGMTSRVVASGVWTGKEFIVWGGEGPGVAYRTGGRYSPSSNQWSYIDPGAVLSARSKHTAVWTGSEMIVWGGYTGGNYFNDGARYSPQTDTWTALAPNPFLAGRYAHFTVWTGTEMIVWGGYNGAGSFADGGAYNPATDQWRMLPTDGAPSARSGEAAVWTGKEVIIWGGTAASTLVQTGARYNPVENRWHPMSSQGAPEGRYWTTVVWTGTEMIVWGGRNSSGASVATGGRYNPMTDSWQPVSVFNAPAAREHSVSVWTGSKLVVWGGYSTLSGSYAQSGGVYDPVTDAWNSLNTTGSPQAYRASTAVWTGRSMLVFGGYNGGYDRNVFSCVIDPLDDGIPASWRQQYFGAEFAHDPRVLATADPDGDGANNYQEYTNGTNPLNADSPGSAPAIAQPPTGQTVLAGSPVTLSATASGTVPLSYQWWKDGSPIVDATTNRLLFANVQVGDAGSYKVGVTNALGGVESAPVQLFVHYSLTVNSGVGGTVTRLPVGASHPPGTGVQLTAAPAEGFAFASWSGDASGSEPSITVLMNSHKTVNASFRETVVPVVQIQSPASGDSLQRVVNLVGTANDNVGITSVRWYRDGQLMGTIATGAGEFRLDGIQLKHGPNTFRVVAFDAAGNEGSAEVVANWNPQRVLAFVTAGPIREGRRTFADLVFTTDAAVGGMTFIVHYDADYLREPRLDWSGPLASSLTQVNTAVPGEVRATFALGSESLAVGQHTLGRLLFRVRSVPDDLNTVLSADILDISGSTGAPLPGLNDTPASSLSLLKRTLIGDNNGNRRLDIGDAAIMQRLLAGIEPVRSWDGPANDLNQSGALDSGDVVKVLRLLARLDGDDLRLTEPTAETSKSAARVAVTAKVASGGPVESGSLTPARQSVLSGEQVTVEVRLENLQTSILGASFALDYPTNALRLLSSESLQVGALVPAGALATWNVAPQPTDYTAQTGRIYLATVSEAPWAGTAGTLARFTFEVQPTVIHQHLWPVTVTGIEVASDGGFENRVLPGGTAFVVGRDPLPPTIAPAEKPKVTENTFSAGFAAELHAVYVIEYSDDLKTWNLLTTVTNTTGTVNINDPAIAARPRCYYRLRQTQ